MNTQRFLHLGTASLLGLGAGLVVCTSSMTAEAGQNPMNVLVVYGSDDPSATEVAHYYETKRSLPTGHLCGLPGIDPTVTSIDVPTFFSTIREPIEACIAALPDPDEIDDLVLVRGLPYVVNLPNYTVSLQAALQVGHSTDSTGAEIAGVGQVTGNASVPNPLFPPGFFNAADSPVTNQYSGWYATGGEIIRTADQLAPFRRSTAPDSGGFHFAGQLFIVHSLDGFDYDDAKALVDRSVASDDTLPTAEILCMHGADDARSARDPECELTTRMLAGAGVNATFLESFDGALAGHTLSAYFTGSADIRGAIDGNTFVPGAIADNLTSFGAVPQNFFCNDDGTVCPASEAQTSIARFVRAGVTGVEGTANEPFNNVFPNAGALLHYSFGYTMGESYLFNQRFLYWQNVYLGDPLAAPFAIRPALTITADSGSAVATATHVNGVSHIALYSAGAKIGEADGASVEVSSPGAEGTVLDLYAVATATDAPVTRTGWPVEAQTPHPGVQGWTASKITLGPPGSMTSSTGSGSTSADATSSGAGGSGGGGDGDSSDDGGCSCEAAGSSLSPTLPLAAASLLMAGALRLRRSSRSRTKRSRPTAGSSAGNGCS